jgi:hypothetical protein
MADFSSYQNQERERRGLLIGSSLGIGAAFAIPAVRQTATRVLLGGVAAVGRKLSKSMSVSPIRSTASELKSLLETALPRAAQSSLGVERSTDLIQKALAKGSPSQVAAVHARELATSTAFQRFLNTGMKKELRGIFKDPEIERIVNRHVAEAHRLDPSTALDKIMTRERGRIYKSMLDSQAVFPSLMEVEKNPVFQQARGQIEQLAATHVGNLGQKTWFDTVASHFGATRVRLGDKSKIVGTLLAPSGGWVGRRSIFAPPPP